MFDKMFSSIKDKNWVIYLKPFSQCSETYISTERNPTKKSIRLRFLDSQKLSDSEARHLEVKVSALQNSFENWAVKAVSKMKKQQLHLAATFKRDIRKR